MSQDDFWPPSQVSKSAVLELAQVTFSKEFVFTSSLLCPFHAPLGQKVLLAVSPESCMLPFILGTGQWASE